MKCRDFRETSWETAGLHTAEDGSLVGEIIATGAGVFSYYDKNGRIVRRLRSIDDVKAATPTLANVPITLLHPTEDVDETNIDRLKVGSVGEAVFEVLNNKVQVKITDKKAIEAIKSGRIRAVSCGYDCRLVQESGNWQGVEYDERQTEIVYNHLALVPRGRAGDGVNFRVRCGDSTDFDKINNKKECKMKKTTLRDGSIVELEDSVFDELKFFAGLAEEKSKAVDSMTAERDAANASISKIQKEMDEMKAKALDEDAIKARVASRISLLKAADAAGVEKAEDMSDREIKCAVIKKNFEDIALEEKSEEYIQAMFDACQSSKKKEDDKKNKNKSLDDRGDKAHDGEEDAYQKMCDQFYGTAKKEA